MTRKKKYQQVINHLMEARNDLANIIVDGASEHIDEPEATAFWFELGCVLNGSVENTSHDVELSGLIRFVEKLEG